MLYRKTYGLFQLKGRKNIGEWKFWRIWIVILIVEAIIIAILRLIIPVD